MHLLGKCKEVVHISGGQGCRQMCFVEPLAWRRIGGDTFSFFLLRMRMYYAQREVAWACRCWKGGNKTPLNKKVKKPRLAAIPRFALTRNIERRMYVYTETQDKDPSCFPLPGICMTNAGRSIPYFPNAKQRGRRREEILNPV